jgi:2-C-methyl-D-erythritol 4-phosphate cytidylyltransferase
MRMKTVAIVPAAGSGSRMNREVSKQYLALSGKPVLVHTLEVLEACPGVDRLLVVVPPQDLSSVRAEVLAPWNFRKVAAIVPGGRERQDSVRAGLDAVDRDADIVLIHDAVRPLISVDLVERCIRAAAEAGAATLGVPVKDTVKEVAPDGRIVRTCDRTMLWLTQTPQAFRRDIIERAHREAFRDGFRGTDDTSLVERLGIAARMIPGDYRNIKITTPEDLVVAEALLAASRQAES